MLAKCINQCFPVIKGIFIHSDQFSNWGMQHSNNRISLVSWANQIFAVLVENSSNLVTFTTLFLC